MPEKLGDEDLFAEADLSVTFQMTESGLLPDIRRGGIY